jgi:hypothetical protein
MSVNEFADKAIDAGQASGAITIYRFVTRAGSTPVLKKFAIAGSGEMPDGIACHTVADGAPVSVAIRGLGWLQVLGNTVNIAVGDYLKPDTGGAGKGVKSAANLEKVGARALGAAVADDVLIPVEIIKMERSIT